MRCFWIALICPLVLALSAFAQQASAGNDSSTTCTFDDGHEITIRFATAGKRQEPQNGVWEPNGSPMFLFTQAPVTLGSTQIPAGAYRLYLSGKKEWALIVSRNTKPDAAYDQEMDLGRSAMESEELVHPQKPIHIELVHPQAKECGLRIFYGEKGYFAYFREP